MIIKKQKIYFIDNNTMSVQSHSFGLGYSPRNARFPAIDPAEQLDNRPEGTPLSPEQIKANKLQWDADRAFINGQQKISEKTRLLYNQFVTTSVPGPTQDWFLPGAQRSQYDYGSIPIDSKTGYSTEKVISHVTQTDQEWGKNRYRNTNGGNSSSPDVQPSHIPPFNGNGQGIETNIKSKPDHSKRVHFPPQPSYGKEAGQQTGVIETLASIADALPAGSKNAMTPEEFKKNNLQQNQNAPVQPLQTARLEATPAMANTKTAKPEQSVTGKENTVQLENDKTSSQVSAGENAQALGQGEIAGALKAGEDATEYVNREDATTNDNNKVMHA